LQSGGTPSRSNAKYWGGDVSWITAKDMKSFWIEDSEDHLTQEGVSQATRIVPSGSTLILTRGMTLHNDVPICRVRKPSAFNQDVKAVLAKGPLRPTLLPHLLVALKPKLLEAVDSAGHGTGRLQTEVLHNIAIVLPGPEEQERIATLFDAVEARIALIRSISVLLEEIARAIFQSWFVDFDPVRAKIEGRSLFGIDAEMTALFPNTLITSPSGEIPSGWQYQKWGDLVTLQYGKALRNYDTSEKRKYPVYGTNGCIGTCDTPLCGKPGIIIGRKGAYRGVHFSSKPFFVIDTAFYVQPIVEMNIRWAYYEITRNDINSMDSGSAIPSTSREDFYKLPVVFPPIAIQQRWAELLDPIWQQQDRNISEICTLEMIRDTLLPKLVSGEVRVREAENMVEVGGISD